MKKFNIPSYFLRTKWLIVLGAIVLLIIFGRTVNTPALTKTAIVLGVGVDYAEGKFKVTTQTVVMASSSSENSGQTSYQTYSAKGNTISSALDDISHKMGLNVALSHCNVLFLTNAVLALDRIQMINPLTGMYALPEHALIVTGDKSPEEMLSIKVGTTVSSPFLLQSALTDLEGTNGMIRTTVKDLLAKSLSRSHACALPYVTTHKAENPPLMQGGNEGDDIYEFDLKRALVLSKDKFHILSEEMTEALALYLSTDTQGSINYKAEDGATVEFRILDKRLSQKAKGRNVSAAMELNVELLDVQFMDEDKIFTGADIEILNAASALADALSQRYLQAFELSKQLDIDFLGLQAKVYQSVGRRLEEDCLDTLSFSPTVKIKVKETA